MSVVNVVAIESFPSEGLLKEIIKYDVIDIITPFYSAWSLKKLEGAAKTKIRLITRLPSQYRCAPVFLDNDPKPLEQAMTYFGSSLLVYAMPEVHAKIYITSENSWLGSANFTRNGFSGKGELLLKVSPTNSEIRKIFSSFLDNSKNVSIRDMRFLMQCVSDGLTEINKINERQVLAEEPIAGSVDYADFQTTRYAGKRILHYR